MSSLQWTTIENAIQAWIVFGSGLASDHVIWAEQTAPRPTGEFISMRMHILDHPGRDWLDRYDNIVGPFGPLAITGVNVGTGALTITAHGLSTGEGPIVFGGTPPPPLQLATNYWPVVVDANTIKLSSTFQNAVAAVPITLALSGSGSSPTLSSTPTTTIAGQEISQRARGGRNAMLTLQCFAGAPTGGSATGTTSPTAILNDAIAAYALESQATALAAAGIGVGRIEPVRSIDGVVNTVRFEPRAIATIRLHLASELVETSTYIQVVNATDNIPTPPIALPPIILP